MFSTPRLSTIWITYKSWQNSRSSQLTQYWVPFRSHVMQWTASWLHAITNKQSGTAFSLYSMGTHTLQVHKQRELKFLSSREEGWKGRSSRGQAAPGSRPFSTPCPETSSSLESSLRNPSQNSRASFHLLPETEKQLFPTVPLSRLTPPSTRQQLYTTVYFLPANAPCLTYENQGLSNPVSHTGTQALFSCLFPLTAWHSVSPTTPWCTYS